MRTVRLINVVSAAVLLSAGSTVAADKEFRSKQSGNWNSVSAPVTWQENVMGVWTDVTNSANLPGVGDKVTIRDGHTVTLTDARSITHVVIEAPSSSTGGLLDIGAAALTLASGGSTYTPAMVIDRAAGVRLTSASSVFRVAANLTVTTGNATGTIEGQNSAAIIEIDPGSGTVQLQNNVPFLGQFIMQERAGQSGTSSFVNNALVHANVNAGTIQLAGSLNSVDDTSGGLRWRMTLGGKLFFNVAATGLQGNFDVGASSVLRCDQNVTTEGTFSIACPGSVDVNSATFDYASVASEDCSEDPHASAISADFTCICAG